jgi:hypothetical protein
MRSLLMNLIAILPALGVLIAVRSLLVVTIVMIAVAVWPFVPRPRFRTAAQRRRRRRRDALTALSKLRQERPESVWPRR